MDTPPLPDPVSSSWKPGPLPAESAEHNHGVLGFCDQRCPAYTARPEGLPHPSAEARVRAAFGPGYPAGRVRVLEDIEPYGISLDVEASPYGGKVFIEEPSGFPWASWPWQRCRARREPRGEGAGEYFGRCELKRGHAGDHALERGFDFPRWTTDWSDGGLHRPAARYRVGEMYAYWEPHHKQLLEDGPRREAVTRDLEVTMRQLALDAGVQLHAEWSVRVRDEEFPMGFEDEQGVWQSGPPLVALLAEARIVRVASWAAARG